MFLRFTERPDNARKPREPVSVPESLLRRAVQRHRRRRARPVWIYRR